MMPRVQIHKAEDGKQHTVKQTKNWMKYTYSQSYHTTKMLNPLHINNRTQK